MDFVETIRLAISAIWVHKLRSALTLLGMIIGVTAVVVVVSLIQGFNRYVDEKIAGIGAKSFSIRRFSFDDWKSTDTIAEAQRRNKDLTFDDFDYIRERATLIDKFGARALPSPGNLKRGSESMERVNVDGATPNIAEIDNLDIAEGRYFIGAENDSAAAVAFLGAEVATIAGGMAHRSDVPSRILRRFRGRRADDGSAPREVLGPSLPGARERRSRGAHRTAGVARKRQASAFQSDSSRTGHDERPNALRVPRRARLWFRFAGG